ncbi:Hypp1497 [Branchiostoma lanceolatum]|uniref:Hypp1497 protein n=1 Tax=Branchiostoma lanceolatum TaxID=7740 RepID=A0A8J9ZIF3_BRALA|nr:Hypp1497 [Branchiostoma lanceolatum]
MAATHRKVVCCILLTLLLVFILSMVHLNSDAMSDDELGLFLQFKKSGTEKKATQDNEEGEQERRHLEAHAYGDRKQEGRATTEVLQGRDGEDQEDYEGEGIGEGGEAEENSDSKLSFSVVNTDRLNDESANGPAYSGYMVGLLLTVSAVVVLGVAVRGAMFLSRRGRRRSAKS